MSLRQRTVMEAPAIDRENLSRLPGKTAAAPKPLLRRPALQELEVNARTAPTVFRKPVITDMQTKKVVTVKVKQTEVKKTKASTTVTETTSTLKRQESTLIKQLVRTESRRGQEDASYSTRQLFGIIDVDANDKHDPYLVSEYVQDIFKYLRSLESKYEIRPNFLAGHRTTARMRAILVNWMVDVHINFKFLYETLHLSVAILDRYLQVNKKVGREALQLVGTAAMVVAGKYEEMYMPEMSDFEYICDHTFTCSQILKMELDILIKLKFNLGRPLSLHFLRRFNKVAKVQPDQHNLAKYLLEICLLEYELCHVDPSLQAAAACCLSISILNEVSDPAKVWTKTLVHYSSYKYSEIKPVMASMAYHLDGMENSKNQAVRKKYAGSASCKISQNPKLQGPLVRKLADEAQALKKA